MNQASDLSSASDSETSSTDSGVYSKGGYEQEDIWSKRRKIKSIKSKDKKRI